MKKATPLIHQTDLFHPHADPDDHWDLATVFSLAVSGYLDLRAVLIDYPPSIRHGDPAICAVSQMNHITGLAVPSAVGIPVNAAGYFDDRGCVSPSESSGVGILIDLLRESDEPVAISIAGSCRDIAIAGSLEPELFREKCRAIYLNAGTSSNDMNLRTRKEYNVTLDPAAYSLIWNIPCPVYWLPCFESVRPPSGDRFAAGKNSSWYSFKHEDILCDLSAEVQQFFLYMYENSADYRWLSYLHRPADERLLSYYAAVDRNMWCTAGFLHAAGLTASHSGEISTPSAATTDGVFSFAPVSLTCSTSAETQWEPCGDSLHNILTLNDVECYPTAMTSALKSLLIQL